MNCKIFQWIRFSDKRSIKNRWCHNRKKNQAPVDAYFFTIRALTHISIAQSTNNRMIMNKQLPPHQINSSVISITKRFVTLFFALSIYSISNVYQSWCNMSELYIYIKIDIYAIIGIVTKKKELLCHKESQWAIFYLKIISHIYVFVFFFFFCIILFSQHVCNVKIRNYWIVTLKR
jgi:hypothetical protein